MWQSSWTSSVIWKVKIVTNYYESEKYSFEQSYHGYQDHQIDQWKTFTFSSTKTSGHGGMYTSRLTCLWSLAVFYLYPSNTIWQILYIGDTYLRYSFITSLNVVTDENTWRSKSIIGLHLWCFLPLVPYLHRSNSFFFLYDVIALFSERLLTLNF